MKKLLGGAGLMVVIAGSFLSIPQTSLAQEREYRDDRNRSCTERITTNGNTTSVTTICREGNTAERCTYQTSPTKTEPQCATLQTDQLEPQAGSQPAQPTPQPVNQQGLANSVVEAGINTGSDAFTQAQFVPLTNLPGLQNVTATDSLPDFLNQLYRLCIGAAAVIAVLQIMRAGAMHMFNKGSLSTSQNVRGLIQNSLLGLLLVLSPAIVFGIINPDILDISLNFGAIKPDPLEDAVRAGVNTVAGALELTTGIDVTVQGSALANGFGADCNDVVEGDRSKCTPFVQRCQAARGTPEVDTGQRNGCPNNAATCTSKLKCNLPAGSSPSQGAPATSQPSTSQITNSEYEWRFLVKNQFGGLVSSAPGQPWPTRGQGYWGSRYPNQESCRQIQEGFLTWVRDNNPSWNVDTSICNCSQPRSQFPQCRQ